MNKYLRIAVSAALLGWIAWHTDWDKVRAAFANLRVGLWLAGLAILVACQVASARRWQVLARELRFERGLLQMFAYYLIGMYFNLFLPTAVGGDVMRAWYLDGGSGRKLASLAAVLLDRVNGLVVLILMACVAVLLAPTPLPLGVRWSVWGSAAASALGLATLPVALRLRLLPAGRRQQLATMVAALKAPRALAEASLWSAFVQVANVLVVWLIGIGLGLDVPLSYYFVFVPMVSLLTLLPSINGMGLRENGIALFLAPLGVDESLSLTLAFLWFAVFVAGGLLGGVVYLCGAYPKPAAPARDASEATEAHGPLGHHPDQGRAGQLDQAA